MDQLFYNMMKKSVISEPKGTKSNCFINKKQLKAKRLSFPLRSYKKKQQLLILI